MSAQVTGPIGLRYGQDPHVFILRFVRENRKRVTDLINRASQRHGGLSHWEEGGFKQSMQASIEDSEPRLALKLAMWAVYDFQALEDEHKRTAFGLPVGLEGDEVGGAVPQNSYDQTVAAGVSAVGAMAGQLLGSLLEMGGGQNDKPAETPPAAQESFLDQYGVVLGVGAVVAALILLR